MLSRSAVASRVIVYTINTMYWSGSGNAVLTMAEIGQDLVRADTFSIQGQTGLWFQSGTNSMRIISSRLELPRFSLGGQIGNVRNTQLPPSRLVCPDFTTSAAIILTQNALLTPKSACILGVRQQQNKRAPRCHTRNQTRNRPPVSNLPPARKPARKRRRSPSGTGQASDKSRRVPFKEPRRCPPR